jgi:hypothetical protein
LRVLF